MNIIDVLIIIQLVIAFPVGVYLFAGKKMTWAGFENMCDRYRYHFFILIGIYLLKSFVFLFEKPMEQYATNYTQMIYGFEGNSIFWVQNVLHSTPMTYFMAIIYISSFLFIMTFSMGLLSYMNMRKAASKLAFLYLVLLFLTIPFYLFVIVYVPSYPKMFYPGSESIITGMEPLMYNLGPNVNQFFMDYDSFNNCFPSMHIGYPTAIIMSLYINVKGYRGYKYFLIAFLALIALAIVYLGIHWLSDIVGGFLIAVIGVIISERYAKGFWKKIHHFDRHLKRRFKWW
ncbi:MAG: phosphatase PAP2 family protein [Candidatus Thermoplasmatota archaeon]|nr:phosphatase PAP2 family protein [Euryarchaeota archaeon]MBU4031472.1 phosphatase PAP2 family protein [Candidatus Thermoplasmatota archaeon]MBU4072212.1 phosphatase PAP2 family protein [Candidatus Thermoplasmatota archaeon]MBU4143975.1 phosphatase PAP2 family protein [Candidatus Thermoplasmatota archaeon]MBU4591911.1 phosphatase PAP2 family protein [Candidatus Thermoplasmatota archaeon]